VLTFVPEMPGMVLALTSPRRRGLSTPMREKNLQRDSTSSVPFALSRPIRTLDEAMLDIELGVELVDGNRPLQNATMGRLLRRDQLIR
jgi:hypothetical protein